MTSEVFIAIPVSAARRTDLLRTRIKKAYRRKALELHPDRNYGDVENATIKFAEVQSAYEVLSDPQERAWYDSHRDSILRGETGPSEEAHFEHNVRLTSAGDIVALISRFTASVPLTDAPNGFYGILGDKFETLAVEESSACDWQGIDPVQYPMFGGSNDDYEVVVKPFYRVWMNFSTKKTFAWRDAYKSADAPDRATRRLVDKENKRLRDEGIREFNDAVRALVAFVRKRDPRFIPNFQSEADRQKRLREAAAAQAARSRATNQAKLNEHVVPDWARTGEPEAEANLTDSSESELEYIECVVCGKIFKSEKQYQTHEKSKKHIKAVQSLQREMRQEDKHLNLGQFSENRGRSSVTGKIDEFEGLSLETRNTENTDEFISSPAQEGTTHEAAPSANSPSRNNKPQSDAFEQPSGVPVEELSTCSDPDTDGDYATQETVENRLVSPVELKSPDELLNTSPPTTSATSIASGNEGASKPRLGRAKAKRAKKVARQELEAADVNQEVKIRNGWTVRKTAYLLTDS